MSLVDRVQEAIDGEVKQDARMRRLNGPTGEGLIVIHRIRGGGKTTELIERVKKENGLLLVRWEDHANYLIETCQLTRKQVMSWHTARHGGLRGLDRRPIYVDDAQMILHEYFDKYRLTGISIT